MINPLPREITVGDKYGPAMQIAEQDEADAYFELCVRHTMDHWGKTREEAERIERSNLGYYAGYFSHATRARVEQLFRCEHPIFGPIANGVPEPDEIFQMGIKAGQAARQRCPECGTPTTTFNLKHDGICSRCADQSLAGHVGRQDSE